MHILRNYQREAIDAVRAYWAQGGGDPVVEIATGGGKSLIIAALGRELFTDYPDLRVLVATHVKELVEQNVSEMIGHWPQAPIGINSAGLGRRDRQSQILFATIQSIHADDAVGGFDLVIIDEAHLVPASGFGMYRALIKRLRDQTKDLRVLGLSATPFRLDAGPIYGEGAPFSDLVYSWDIGDGIREKYLSPLVARAGSAEIDVTGVGRRGGEFIQHELERRISREGTALACRDIVERGRDRNAWLVLCISVDHAAMACEALCDLGVAAAVVTGETPRAERDQAIQAFRTGKLQALCNVNVLTTGFNVPQVDLIAMLRPTLSTGLYAQMIGRGVRLADGKINCAVLDYAGNVRRHGPVDDLSIRARNACDASDVRASVDSVRAKECPHCEALVARNATICPHCDHEFSDSTPRSGHAARADEDAILLRSEAEQTWLRVTAVKAYRHTKPAPGSTATLRMEYAVSPFQSYREWICFDHMGYPRGRAEAWWRGMTGEALAPLSVDRALEALSHAPLDVEAIRVARDGQWWSVVGRRVRRPDGALIEVLRNMSARLVIEEHAA